MTRGRQTSEMSSCHFTPLVSFKLHLRRAVEIYSFFFPFLLWNFSSFSPKGSLLPKNLISFESWRPFMALAANSCALTRLPGVGRVHLGVGRARGLSQTVMQATKSSALSMLFLRHTESIGAALGQGNGCSVLAGQVQTMLPCDVHKSKLTLRAQYGLEFQSNLFEQLHFCILTYPF